MNFVPHMRHAERNSFTIARQISRRLRREFFANQNSSLLRVCCCVAGRNKTDRPRAGQFPVDCALGLNPNARWSRVSVLVGSPKFVYGSTRIFTLRNSIGAPSASKAIKPLAGSQPFPPETSWPLTHKRTSPLIARM